jgi:hypothetical protein
VASPDVLAASRRGDVRGRRVNERARVVRRLHSSGQIRIASRWFLPRRACGNNSSCSRSHTMKFLRTSSTSSTTRRSDPPERPATDAGALQGMTWRRRAGGSLRPEEASYLHPVIPDQALNLATRVSYTSTPCARPERAEIWTIWMLPRMLPRTGHAQSPCRLRDLVMRRLPSRSVASRTIHTCP